MGNEFSGISERVKGITKEDVKDFIFLKKKGIFSFPPVNRKKIREEWLKVCDLPASTDTKNIFVCFRHFHLKDLEELSNWFKPFPGKFEDIL